MVWVTLLLGLQNCQEQPANFQSSLKEKNNNSSQRNTQGRFATTFQAYATGPHSCLSTAILGVCGCGPREFQAFARAFPQIQIQCWASA